MKFRHLTAPVYAQLLPAKLLDWDVNESKATCDNCLKARAPTPVKERYHQDLRCCTYHPFLPNFAVGGILSDPRFPHGQQVIRDMIDQHRYVLPIGILPPVRYQMSFRRRKPKDFGNREDFLCPYLDREKKNCSIWAYRGTVCTSFYCQSSYGVKGKKFWNQVSDYLSFVEMALLEEALIRLDFSPRQISDQLEYLNREEATKKELSSWNLSTAEHQRHWRDYERDVEGFYIKCFQLVKGFGRKDFEEMLGELGQNLEQSLRFPQQERP